MLTYGTQVNPSLLRQDFSPILQAAQAQAQATQQAAQMRAQSMANFGQVVSKGIQDFLKKKEEKDLEQKGVEFIKSQIPGIDDKAALAGLKAAGGPAAFVKFQQDMAQSRTQQTVQDMQLAELKRGVAEQERLRQILSTSPAAAAIQTGAKFEQLPTGAGAFTPVPRSAQEFMSTAQAAGISPTTYLPLASQMAGYEKTLAETKALQAKPAANAKTETYKTSERGYPEEVTIEIAPNGARRELGRVAINVPEGMKRLPDGSLAPEKGGKQDVEKNAKDAAFQKSYETGLEQARVMLNAMANAGSIITEPLLSYQGFGSTLFGWTPTAASLDGYYQTINANQALNTIREARKESPSGGNPYGQLAVKEFESAASLQGTFNKNLEDKVVIDNMEQVAGILFKAYPQLKDEYDSVLKSAFGKIKESKPVNNPVLPSGWSFR